MIRTSRKLFVGVLALFILFCLWWAFHIPYNRARLYLAVPDNPTYVGEHSRLDKRWKKALKNPLMRQILAESGIVEADAIDQLKNDKRINQAMRWLFPHNAVITYTPNFRLLGRPAWIISSWLGERGRIFSSSVITKRLNDLVEVELNGHRKGWYMKIADDGPYTHLIFAVIDGVLVACLSSDTSDLQYLVDEVDTAHTKGRAKIEMYDLGHGASDAGWYASSAMGISDIRYGIKSISENKVSGRIRLTSRLPVFKKTSVISRIDIEQIFGFVGDEPDMLLMVPYGDIHRALVHSELDIRLRTMLTELNNLAAKDAPAFVALLGGEYSIHITTEEFPAASVIAGVRLKGREEDALDRIPYVLEQLNRTYDTTFLPRRDVIAGRPVVVLENRKGDYYLGRQPRQKIVAIPVEGWLVVASSLEVLDKIFADRPDGSKAPRIKQDGSAAYLWANLDKACQSVENAFALQRMALWERTDSRSERKKSTIKSRMKWLDAIRLLGNGSACLKSEGDDTVIRFTLSKKLKYGGTP